MIEKIGSDWGGWYIDSSLVKDGDLIISAGLAHDITFDKGIIDKFKVKILGIDPTFTSYRTVLFESIINQDFRRRFQYIKKAISDRAGYLRLGGPAGTFLSSKGKKYRTITIPEISKSIEIDQVISIVKLDIEGAEYLVCDDLVNFIVERKVKQIAIEFHHWFQTSLDNHKVEYIRNVYSLENTINMINKITGCGYKFVFNKCENEKMIFQDTLFIRNDLAESYKSINI